MSDPLALFTQAQSKADEGDLEAAIALADRAMEAWDAEERSARARNCTGLVTVAARLLFFIGFVGLIGQVS